MSAPRAQFPPAIKADPGALRTMRRLTPLLLLLGLSGCTGFGEFLDHAFSPPGTNPNIPMADSENVRRVLGMESEIRPLEVEPGNIWPGPPPPEPTLEDIQNNPGREDQRGFPPTAVPGERPGLPAGREPHPTTRGSSTPPGSNQPPLPAAPARARVPATAAVCRATHAARRPPNAARPRDRLRRHGQLPRAHHAARPGRHRCSQRQRHQHRHQPRWNGPNHPDPALTC